ncbi:MAG: hypothetical protein R3222_02400 [Balneolaceae bacterium]|nr:hypothetical protein [Balneolaceae bacterium]
MPGLKYIMLTCFCIILYSIIPEETERKPAVFDAKGGIADNFSIEELLSSRDKAIRDIHSKDVRIRSAWTYEKTAGITPAGSEDRFYGTSFSYSDARFICWELILEHAPVQFDRDLNLEFTLYNGEDQKISQGIADSWISSGSEITEHTACWGSAYPGSWEKGDYRYSIQYKPQGTDTQSALEHEVTFRAY